MVKSTPSKPPRPAMAMTQRLSNASQYPSRMSAGNVKITPAASDSPADAAVCTMLFSRMLELRNRLRIAIEITAAGMDADTVNPANRPR